MTLNFENVQRHILAIAESKNITLEEAENLLSKSTLILKANDEIKTSINMQVAFLSCFNAGNRIFAESLTCILPENIPNLLKFKGKTFEDVLETFFAINKSKTLNPKSAKILFGIEPSSENEVEVVFSGWQAGLNIFNSKRISLKSKSNSIPLGAILGSSYSLFWAFEYTFNITNSSFKESFGYSLWKPVLDDNWHAIEGEGPENIWLPKKLWMVGLGHLGQSNLWTLSFLYFESEFEVLLQDFDKLKLENLGSQILSFKDQIGKHKTRICSEYLQSIGLETRILEKPFNGNDQKDEYLSSFNTLITGLDNIKSRAIINPDQFEICLDGAANGHIKNFDSFTFRNLKLFDKKPNEIWKEESENEAYLHQNLVKIVEKNGGCGELTNFGISTPFVGLFGSSITISEFIKNCNKCDKTAIFSGKMRTTASYSSV